ncbi:lysozyme 1 [Aphelenchoides avenae]|nr:lysozyme 1 [Aphelenchus avenae]
MTRTAPQPPLRSMRCVTSLVLLLISPLSAQDLYGFDIAEEITWSAFQCMASNFNFFVASLTNASTGSADAVVIENVRRARDAGFTNIEGYLTPCAASNCPSAHQQVANALGTLRQRELTLSQVWVDVSGTEWPCDVTKNRKLIWALVRSIAAYGLPVGIRTNPDRWATIVGEWSELSAYYPLWFGRPGFHEFPLCSDFVSFGGWRKFDICQSCDNSDGCFDWKLQCDVPNSWRVDARLAASPTTGYTSPITATTELPVTTTTSTSTSTSTSTTITTPTTTLKPTTRSTTITTTLKPDDTTTTTPPTTPEATTAFTTTTTTELTATTRKCRFWVFC